MRSNSCAVSFPKSCCGVRYVQCCARRSGAPRRRDVPPTKRDRVTSSGGGTQTFRFDKGKLRRSSQNESQLSCRHFRECSGCTIENDIKKPPIYKRAVHLFEKKGVSFDIACGEVHGWRTRARLAVRDRRGKVAVGLFRTGTHECVDIPQCQVHHPRITTVANNIADCIESTGMTAYSETTLSGDVRYLQLTAVAWDAVLPSSPQADKWEVSPPPAAKSPWQCDPEACSVEVVLVWNGKEGDEEAFRRATKLANHIWRTMGPQGGAAPLVASVWINWQPKRTNTILGQSWTHLFGADTLCFDLGGGPSRPIFTHPGAFLQANGAMAATAVREMREAVHRRGGGRRILDLYAGVGSLGLSIAGPSASLRCVEVTPSAAAPFTRSAAAARTDRVDASLEICSAAETPEDWLGAPWDLVIVDPPRKGLEGGLREALCRAEGVETLMYLSCGFPALERDLEALHAGGWRVAEASGFLFFPGTDHLETLVVMERA